MHTAAILTAVAVAAVNINAVLAECAHNNLIRCLIGHQEPAISFCSSAVGIFPTASTLTVTTTATPMCAHSPHLLRAPPPAANPLPPP